MQELAEHTEAEILSFHGIGPSSIPKLRTGLMEQGKEFKKEEKRKQQPAKHK